MDLCRNKKLTLVADENMPHLDVLFASIDEVAEIKRLPGRQIKAVDLACADVLLVRSITQVNASLLANSPVQFVGTATIGTDHLDKDWLNKNNITWTSAAGCNKSAVGQYVLSGIAYWLQQQNSLADKKPELKDITVGLIGAGNVGSQLAIYLKSLGVSFKLYDPPLQRQGDKRPMATLGEILECDVISFHVPLTHSGQDATLSMCDAGFLQQLNAKQLVINASRGEVIEAKALAAYLNQPQHAEFILDVFCNEPNIDLSLASLCLLATPHIAGHTLEGKTRGSFMLYQAFCQHFNLQQSVNLADLLPAKNHLSDLDEKQNTLDSQLTRLLAIYDISADSQRLLAADKNNIGAYFDGLRRDYPSFFTPQPRRDYDGWQANNKLPDTIVKLLNAKAVSPTEFIR